MGQNKTSSPTILTFLPEAIRKDYYSPQNLPDFGRVFDLFEESRASSQVRVSVYVSLPEQFSGFSNREVGVIT